MASEPAFPSKVDLEYVENFRVLNALLKNCEGSEKAALLLSTCRNAYLTANALFAELQVLMGDAVEFSALRGACELLIQGEEGARVRQRFGRAVQTVREFERKREVWRDRLSIWEDIQQSKRGLGETDRLAPDRIDLLLKSTRIDAQSIGNGWSHEVRALDLQEHHQLAASFTALNRIFDVLRYAAELGLGVASLLSQEVQTQLDLGDTDEEFDEAATAVRVVELSVSLARECGWVISDSNDKRIVAITGGYERPRNSKYISQIDLPISPAVSAVRGAGRDFGTLIREALYVAHGQMCASFKPNVAKAPMPAPFLIDLPMPVPSHDSGANRKLEIAKVRSTAVELPQDTVRLAIANLAVPFRSHMSGRTYRLTDEAGVHVKTDALKAIQAAAVGGARAIVFPEYSLPSSMESELMRLAAHHNLAIIAGFEGEWIEGKLSDRAIVALPGEVKAHFQRKQEPSLDEESGDAFYRDGKLLLFSNSPVGEFAVIVCSDFLELSTLQVWKPDGPLPELFFVVARNSYPELYFSFAKADAFRLYSAIIIANVYDQEDEATNEGSGVIVPKREKSQVLDGTKIAVEGNFLKSIDIYDVPLRAIRARSRGKPESGYFAVPQSAKRS